MVYVLDHSLEVTIRKTFIWKEKGRKKKVEELQLTWELWVIHDF